MCVMTKPVSQRDGAAYAGEEERVKGGVLARSLARSHSRRACSLCLSVSCDAIHCCYDPLLITSPLAVATFLPLLLLGILFYCHLSFLFLVTARDLSSSLTSVDSLSHWH